MTAKKRPDPPTALFFQLEIAISEKDYAKIDELILELRQAGYEVRPTAPVTGAPTRPEKGGVE